MQCKQKQVACGEVNYYSTTGNDAEITRDDRTCIPCDNAYCRANEYRAGSCSGLSNGYSCHPCSNQQCLENQFQTGFCSGTTDGFSCVACNNIACPAEHYRYGDCSGRSNKYACHPQPKCGPGQWADKSGESCSNRGPGCVPVLWDCKPCPEGTWHSENDHYHSEAICQPHRTCEPGQKIDAEAVATRDRECFTCGDHTYQDENLHQNTACKPQPTCGKSQRISAPTITQPQTCESCPLGQFRDDDIHRETECKTAGRCGQGERLLRTSTSSENVVCGPCPRGQYHDSSSHVDLECKPQVLCGAGHYFSSTGLSAAGSCEPCSTSLPLLTYQTAVSHRDETCLSQPPCRRNEYLALTDLTTHTLRTCLACPAGTGNPYDAHFESNCEPEVACGPGLRWIPGELGHTGSKKIAARYLRIDSLALQKDGRYINLQEVQAFRNESDDALLAATAKMSSTYSGSYEAVECVDGIAGVTGNMCHTSQRDEAPWLRLDFGAPVDVAKIVVLNRADCCQGRIVGARVSLSNYANGSSPVWSATFDGEQYVYSWVVDGRNSQCQLCPEGTYMSEVMHQHGSCITNPFCGDGLRQTQLTKYISKPVCQPCPVGQYPSTVDGSMIKTLCFEQPTCRRDEYISPEDGVNKQNCFPCDATFYQPEDSHRRETCLSLPWCSAGQHLTNESVSGTWECVECEVGKYMPEEMHRNQNCIDQIECDLGQQISAPSAVAATSCTDCAPGQFQDLKANANNPLATCRPHPECRDGEVLDDNTTTTREGVCVRKTITAAGWSRTNVLDDITHTGVFGGDDTQLCLTQDVVYTFGALTLIDPAGVTGDVNYYFDGAPKGWFSQGFSGAVQVISASTPGDLSLCLNKCHCDGLDDTAQNTIEQLREAGANASGIVEPSHVGTPVDHCDGGLASFLYQCQIDVMMKDAAGNRALVQRITATVNRPGNFSIDKFCRHVPDDLRVRLNRSAAELFLPAAGSASDPCPPGADQAACKTACLDPEEGAQPFLEQGGPQSSVYKLAVGQTYWIPPINTVNRSVFVVTTGSQGIDNTITFSTSVAFDTNETSNVFFTDPATGLIVVEPSSLGNGLVEVQATDKNNEQAIVQTFEVRVLYGDLDVRSGATGPNGRTCEHGVPFDEERFNDRFICHCEIGYSGDNCELNACEGKNASLHCFKLGTDSLAFDPVTGQCDCRCKAEYTHGDLNRCERLRASLSSKSEPFVEKPAFAGIMGAFGAVVLLMIGMLYWSRSRIRRERMRAFDFQVQIKRLLQQGDLDEIDTDARAHPREIKRAYVTLTQRLGAGSFGEVCRGVLDESYELDAVPAYAVAVKTCKDLVGTGADDLRREATVMAQLGSHPNIVSLIGVVTRGSPLLVIMSLCENGSLQAELQRSSAQGHPMIRKTQYAIARQVALGMDYLVSKHFVHRDLAARNVLLDSAWTAKIADFGLTRSSRKSEQSGVESGAEEYYRSEAGVFPVRWAAPESMAELRFTFASDVWAYSVMLYEMLTNCAHKPYPEISTNAEVIQRVSAGYRLKQPPDCEDLLYGAMLVMFSEEPADRPTFAEIASFFEDRIVILEAVAPSGTTPTPVGLAIKHGYGQTTSKSGADDGSGEVSINIHSDEGSASSVLTLRARETLSYEREAAKELEEATASRIVTKLSSNSQAPPSGAAWWSKLDKVARQPGAATILSGMKRRATQKKLAAKEYRALMDRCDTGEIEFVDGEDEYEPVVTVPNYPKLVARTSPTAFSHAANSVDGRKERTFGDWDEDGLPKSPKLKQASDDSGTMVATVYEYDGGVGARPGFSVGMSAPPTIIEAQYEYGGAAAFGAPGAAPKPMMARELSEFYVQPNVSGAVAATSNDTYAPENAPAVPPRAGWTAPPTIHEGKYEYGEAVPDAPRATPRSDATRMTSDDYVQPKVVGVVAATSSEIYLPENAPVVPPRPGRRRQSKSAL